MYNVNFACGLQRLIDAQMQFTRTGHSVALRIRNFPDLQDQEWSQLGFTITPTGTQTGTTDIPVKPTPAVYMVSLHNIAASMGKLRFGARIFGISATFTDAQVSAGIFTSQDLVWRDPKVVGLVCDGQLFSIEDIKHYEIAGKTIRWDITGNSLENR